jgi:hypothetical protein
VIVRSEDLVFEDEESATSFLITCLDPHFETFSQVCMDGEVDPKRKYRIDLVARSRDERRWLIGFEIKSHFLFMKEYANALKQAADYVRATISGPVEPTELAAQKLCCTFVFPKWNGLHDSGEREYASEALGMEILAQKFRVGACTLGGHSHGLTLIMGQGRLWSAGAGWVEDAERILFGKRRIGGRRLLE